jgi:hypothetical protein
MRKAPAGKYASTSVALLLLAVETFSAPAIAGSPFDGEWKGATKSEDKCRDAPMTATVKDGEIEIHYLSMVARASIKGSIAPDGTVTGVWIAPSGDRKGAFHGKITGGRLVSAPYTDACGSPQTFELTRAN